MSKLINITDKSQLNNFISTQAHSQFLQSWQWGELQKKSNHKIFRLGIKQNNRLVASAFFVKKTLPLGRSYFYCPRGPIVNSQLILEFLLSEIAKLAEQEKALFFRFEPERELRIKNLEFRIFKTLDIQPSKTILLNLSKSEEELLKNMHQKTRYNIRLAEKRGVEIIEAKTEDFSEFWGLMEKTSQRDGFRLHDKNHYQAILEELNNEKKSNYSPIAKLLLAQYQGRTIAAVLLVLFGDTVIYLHGASSNEHRNVMAPYLLQWSAIKLAKELGHKYYDFYGIDAIKWPGVTRFKKGFGGEILKYPGTFDLVFSKELYTLYRLIRRVRRGL